MALRMINIKRWPDQKGDSHEPTTILVPSSDIEAVELMNMLANPPEIEERMAALAEQARKISPEAEVAVENLHEVLKNMTPRMLMVSMIKSCWRRPRKIRRVDAPIELK